MKENHTSLSNSPNSRLSIAPMMAYTDRFFRVLFRHLSQKTLLYTEMIAAETLFYANSEKLSQILTIHNIEKPIIAQIGGSDPQKMALAARICADFGYDGLNINAGCPSERVQNAKMGACLMREPETIIRCIEAMQTAKLPISLKHRLGVDEQDSYEQLSSFIEQISQVGLNHFIIHARQAYLRGLSPSRNRTIPELKPHFVYQIKNQFPHLTIEINGDVQNLNTVQNHLHHVDGVMIGRAAYKNPWAFSKADTEIFAATHNPANTQAEFLQNFSEFLNQNPEFASKNTIRHLMNIRHGQANAKQWRNFLSEILKAKEIPNLRTALNPFMESPTRLLQNSVLSEI